MTGVRRTQRGGVSSVPAACFRMLPSNSSRDIATLTNPCDFLFAGRRRQASYRVTPSRVAFGGVGFPPHEAIEERGELVVGIEREHMRNVLVWTDDGDAALLPINTPHLENVRSEEHSCREIV